MKQLFTFCFCLLCFYVANAQQNVGIGTTSPDSSAALDISSSNKGFLMPRLTKNQRNTIPNPKAGLIIYQTDSTAGTYQFNGNSWSIIGGNTTAGNGLTKVGDSIKLGGSLTENTTINIQNGSLNYIAFKPETAVVQQLSSNTTFTVGYNSWNTIGQSFKAVSNNGISKMVFKINSPNTAISYYLKNGLGIYGSNVTTGTATSNANGDLTINLNIGTTTNQVFTIFFSTISPYTSSFVASNANPYADGNVYEGVSNTSYTSTDLLFQIFESGSTKTGLTINSQTANVGIGTSNPTSPLHVVGNATISSLSGTGSRMIVADSAGLLSSQTISNTIASNGLNKVGDTVIFGGVINRNTDVRILNGNNVNYNATAVSTQSFTHSPTDTTNGNITAGSSFGQSFTTTVAGTLSQFRFINVGVPVNPTTVSYTVYKGNGASGLPVVASGSVVVTSNGFITIPMNSICSVNDVYTVIVSANQVLRVPHTAYSSYSGGTIFFAGSAIASIDYTFDYGVSAFSENSALTITGTNGNVGIGNNNPTTKLDVVGNAKISSLSGSGNRMVVADASGVLSSQTIPTGNVGTVTNVTGTSPIAITNGSSTPAISISQANTTTNGFLSSTDFNIFSNKQNALSNANATTTGILTSTDWNTFNNKQNKLTKASSTDSGYLSSADFNTFNNKQNALSNANATTAGILTSTDWNTFNNKQNTLPAASATTNGYLSSVDWNAFNNKSGPISLYTANATTTGLLESEDWKTFNNKQEKLNKASSTDSGYLSSADWNTFNNKLNALNKASATDSGYLSSADWNTFNNKLNALSKVSATDSGYLSSTDWNTFNNKFSLPNLTNGSLLFSDGTTISQNNNKLFWNDATGQLGIGTNSPTEMLTVAGNITSTATINAAKLNIAGTGGATISSSNNGSGTGDWIAINAGGIVGDRVVAGTFNGEAAVGAHNSALDTWSTLTLNPGGAVKIPSLVGTNNRMVIANGSGTLSTVPIPSTNGVVYVSANAPLSVAGSAGYYPILNIAQAGTSSNGYLSSTDWNTFNNKSNVTANNGLTVSGSNVSMGGTLSQNTVVFTENSSLTFKAGNQTAVAAAANYTSTVGNFNVNYGVGGYVAQSFTATRTGLINVINIHTFAGSGTFTFTLFDGEGVGGTVLKTGTSSAAYANPTNFIWYDLVINTACVKNQKYTIMLSNPTNQITPSITNNTYSGGSAYQNGTNYTNNDLYFQVSEIGTSIDALTITNPNGYVGIGATNPNAPLTINSTNNGIGNTDWIAANIGGTAGGRVVAGVYNGKATIAAHNNGLTAWDTLNINPVGVVKLGGLAGTGVRNVVVDADGNISTQSTLNIANANATTTGLLSSTDWNTFNNKQNALSNANTTTNGILTSTDWNIFNNKQNKLTKASATDSGYLSSADWNTFNNKSNYTLPALTNGSLLFSNGTTIAQNNSNLFWNNTNNNLGIGTATPNSSAVLDVSSTNKGFLMPKMTKTQRNAISSPSEGLQIYQIDSTKGVYVYSNGEWCPMMMRLGKNKITRDTVRFTNAPSTYTIPNAVSKVKIYLYGASGGKGYSRYYHIDSCFGVASNDTIQSNPNNGVGVSGELNVTTGQQLFFNIGGKGNNGITSYGVIATVSGGYNNGGTATSQLSPFQAVDFWCPPKTAFVYRQDNYYNSGGGGGGFSSVGLGSTYSYVLTANGGNGGDAGRSTGGSFSYGGIGAGNNSYSSPITNYSNLGSTNTGNGYAVVEYETSYTTDNSNYIDSILKSLTNGASIVTNVIGSAPLQVSMASNTATVSMAQANASTNGYLSNTDWNTFNNKQNALPNANSTTAGILTSTDWNTI